jgi:hypothetical protein
MSNKIVAVKSRIIKPPIDPLFHYRAIEQPETLRTVVSLTLGDSLVTGCEVALSEK